jgi:hypothetical protein
LLTNVAVTAVSDEIVTVQPAVPWHPDPFQPAKVNPVDGVACKLIAPPILKLEVQLLPQSIPDGVLETLPLPIFVTVSMALVWAKFAVQLLFAFMVTDPLVQSTSPLQPVNTEPVAGIGVKLITIPDE